MNDSILWKSVADELRESPDSLHECSIDSEDSEDDFGFVLGIQPRPDPKSRHPPPEGIQELWKIFIENIDPLTKVLHVPSLWPAVNKAANNIEVIPRAFEALMFAIYSAAVMSLGDDECKSRLNAPRKTLLSRYIAATKRALARAKFMGSTNLVVLQALALHLLSVRDSYEPRAIWSLTGVAIRIAQGMGLERDGVHLGLAPFETEMRRRIWWQIKTHDFRTGELCGIAKFQDLHTGSDTPKWPTNVDDDQLYPGMPSPATSSKVMTDSVLIALKGELLNFAAARIADFRRQGKAPGAWELHMRDNDTTEVDRLLEEIEETLETKYIRYCDPSRPLHLFTMLMARSSMNIIRLLSHHPRRWANFEQAPMSEQLWVWNVCINLLEQHTMLLTNPQLNAFAWHAPYFQQWHAVIHVLGTLCNGSLAVDYGKAWALISKIYQGTPEMASDMRKPIHVAVGNLCLKAYRKHKAVLEKNKSAVPPPTPGFIVKLNEQRDSIKAKQSQAKTKKAEVSRTLNQASTGDKDVPSGPGITIQGNPPSSIPAHSITHGTDETLLGTQEESFWLTQGLDSSILNNINDMMDFDFDFSPNTDLSLEEPSSHTIDWDQWDTWLAQSNILRPLTPDQGS
ncbi:hypothetical protein PFICI_09964 [Pestalotiopsis fici W106-1]|uniref:Xylanolytic transcriptional activator regulatory domain-containing protein n=1 Tax=Pestalotiopsis fici (strain W106-1 / CGMCC3.15140) TaxID=1229662 RepID=W3WXP5_PESFW|nr:uncharacterized protein PFICI_09964 [Pestalotiopsis fici W106-1]ETS77902.1 hypothetical protein PFICI_09964 [Pestalotiopsis fici W106-1]